MKTSQYKKKMKSVYFRVPFANSFVVLLEFFILMRNYVVLRTSLRFQGLTIKNDIDSLNLVHGFLEMLWQPFYPLLTKGPKNLYFPADKKTLYIQYNTLHGLTFYKQSYWRDNQFCTIFDSHEE